MNPDARTSNDAEHLRLLSIFHYVVGGMTVLFALFPTLHLVMGIAMVTGRLDDGPDPMDARFLGWFFIVVAAAMIVAGITLAVSMILTGRFLARRVNYTFCFVIAALACVIVPFGTVLGVFTIVVLQRPTVKEMFVATKPVGGT